MSEEKEFDQLLRVKPDVLQALLLFKMYKSLKRTEDKLGAFVTFMGPMTRMFKRELQYQHKTVEAGSHDTVFKLENPRPGLLVGIITQVANDWYPDTFLEWYIDHKQKKIEYKIADFKNPKEFSRGIPFYAEVEWIVYNNSDSDYDFGVLMDGFFLPKDLYKKIIIGR